MHDLRQGCETEGGLRRKGRAEQRESKGERKINKDEQNIQLEVRAMITYFVPCPNNRHGEKTFN